MPLAELPSQSPPLSISESELRVLVEQLPVAAYACGPDGSILWHNRQAVELWGRAPRPDDRYCGAFRATWPDGSAPKPEECCMLRALEERREFRQELIFEHPGGDRRIVAASARPVFNAASGLIGAVSAIVDSTVEKKSVENDRFLAALVEQSDDAILTVSKGGRIRTWNRGAERLFGFLSEEMVGNALAAITHRDHTGESRQIFERALQGEVVRTEVIWSHQDGTRVDVALTASPVLDDNGQIVGVCGVARDITARKRVEQERDITRRRYEMLAETSPWMVFHTDHRGQFNYVNDARWTELTGREPGSWAGEGWAAGVHADDRQRVFASWSEAVSSGASEWEEELRFQHIDGSETWVLARGRPLRSDDGVTDSFVGACAVISDRKRFEEALQVTNEELEARVAERTGELCAKVEQLSAAGKRLRELELAVENSMTGISELDAAGHFREVSEAYAAMLGYQREEMIGMSWVPTVAKDDLPAAEAAYYSMLSDKQADVDVQVMRKDNSRSFIHILFVRKDDAAGRFAGHYCFMRDVTERRAAERELRLRNRAIEAAGNGLFITDPNQPDNPIIDCNPALLRITGFTRGEILGRNCRFLHADDCDQPGLEVIRHAVETGTECHATVRNYRKNGELFWNELVLSPVRDDAERLTHFVGVVNDVTRQWEIARVLEQEVARSEQILTTTLEGYILADLAGCICEVNPAYCAMIGYSRKELIGTNVRNLEAHYDGEEVNRRIQTLKRDGRARFEARHRHRDGPIVDLEVSLSMLVNDGDPLVVGFVRDITGRKQAEKRLARRSDFERLLLNLSADFITSDPVQLEQAARDALAAAGQFAEADRSYVFIFSDDRSTASNTHEWCADGVVPQIEFLQDVPVSMFPWMSAQLMNRECVYFTGLDQLPPEAEIDRQGFEAQSIRSLVSLPIQFAGEVVGFVGFDAIGECRSWDKSIHALLKIIGDIFVNAQRRLEAEQSLKESEEKWRSLVNNAPSYISLIDREGRLQFVNRTAEGYDRDRIVGAAALEFVPESRHEFARDLLARVFDHRESPQYEIQDVEGVWYSCHLAPVIHEGEVSSAICISTDISAQMQTQGELQDKTTLLDEAQRLANLGNWEWDLRSNGMQWSDGLCRIYGFEPSCFEPTCENFITSLVPDDRARHRSSLDKIRALGGSFEIEERIIRNDDGEERILDFFGYAIRDESGKVVKLRGVCQDVTARRLAKLQLHKSLREKETLLREIHHRVKNNLQIVSSLLHFQGRKLTDPSAMEIIREGQERLRAMILVHEQLYGSEDLSRIDFGAYLRRLADDMLSSRIGLIGGEEPEIILNVYAEPVFLHIEIALPIGMIVNELVTNAFKYAFLERSSGKIEIQLEESQSALILRVSDDGRGLPENVPGDEPETFGMRLIHNLAGQIGAGIDFQCAGGTVATLRLRVDN